jgi:hypothetical protein
MNEISPEQRERILARLREGRSLRSIEAETGHRRETIGRYGREAGILPVKARAEAATIETNASENLRMAA